MNLPYDLLELILLYFEYEDVQMVIHYKLVEDIISSRSFWVARTRLDAPLFVRLFDHPLMIETDYPFRTNIINPYQRRYVELVSRRGVVSDTKYYLAPSICLERALKKQNERLIDYFIPLCSSAQFANKVVDVGRVDLYLQYLEQIGSSDDEFFAFCRGIGNHSGQDDHDRLFFCGLVVGGHIVSMTDPRWRDQATINRETLRYIIRGGSVPLFEEYRGHFIQTEFISILDRILAYDSVPELKPEMVDHLLKIHRTDMLIERLLMYHPPDFIKRNQVDVSGHDKNLIRCNPYLLEYLDLFPALLRRFRFLEGLETFTNLVFRYHRFKIKTSNFDVENLAQYSEEQLKTLASELCLLLPFNESRCGLEDRITSSLKCLTPWK